MKDLYYGVLLILFWQGINMANHNNNNQINELPHDLLAEKAMVGSLIIDGSVFDEISNLKITKDHFYDPRYGMIYDVIADLSLSNRAIDYVTVCSKLQEKGKLEEIGGQSFVLTLVEDQASSANVYDYAKIVKDKSSMREIIRTATGPSGVRGCGGGRGVRARGAGGGGD